MNPKDKILVEMATLMRYMADLVDQLVDDKTAIVKAEPLAKPFGEGLGSVASDVPLVPQPEISLEQVRAALSRKSQEGFTAMVRALVANYGAKKLSDVNPKYYAKLMAQAEALK